MASTESADAKKRTHTTTIQDEAIKKSKTDAPIPAGSVFLQKDSVGVGIAAMAGGLYARGLETLDVANDPHSQFLVMICSNAEASEKRRLDKGGDSYPINCVIIRPLKAGFSTSPYEPKDSMQGHRLFTDKDGKATVKGVAMNTVQSAMMDGKSVDLSVFRSYNVHQKQKTKGRGLTTDVVGSLLPGTPMTLWIYHDKRDQIMNFNTTEVDLCEFSLAIMKLGVRSNEHCMSGYGVALKGLQALKGIKPTTYGLYPTTSTYNDRETVHAQTSNMLQIKKFATGDFENDLHFVNLMIRKANSATVNEKPIILIDLKKEIFLKQRHTLNIHENKTVVLDFQDPQSLFNQHKFAVVVPKGVFTPNTNILWIRDYYQFCIDARIASITVLYDEYWMNKNAEKLGCAHAECVIAIDEEALFKGIGGKLSLTPAVLSCLGAKNEFIHTPIDFDETKGDITDKKKSPRWNGWSVFKDDDKGLHQFCILDTLKTRTMASVDGNCELEQEHTSLICQVYPGMSDKRMIWTMYLCTAHDNKLVSVVGVGVQKIKTSMVPDLVQRPASVGVYANHHMLLS